LVLRKIVARPNLQGNSSRRFPTVYCSRNCLCKQSLSSQRLMVGVIYCEVDGIVAHCLNNRLLSRKLSQTTKILSQK